MDRGPALVPHAGGECRLVEFHLGNRAAEICQAAFHFRRIREVCAHAPPDPGQAAWEIELFSQLHNHICTAVAFEKRQRKRDPLPARHDSYHVEQEHEEVVRLPGDPGDRSFMHNLEVDQPRTVCPRIVENILRCGVAMRPPPAEFIARKLMSAAKFGSAGLQHSLCQCAAIHVVPKTFARQLLSHYAAGARGISAKAIAIQHFETFHLPALPIFHFAPETNRNTGHAKIEIGQIC